MKLAIIGGISDYSTQPKLDACKNDAETLRAFIADTKAYSDICFLEAATTGIDAKKSISDFIEKHRGNPIKELLFYFSGHGDRSEDDFFYALSDYKTERREVTGLRNSELDSLIRNLSPELTVKIVDACFSGSTYIKAEDDLAPVLQKSAKDNQLNKLYFLHSSAADQTSLAGPKFSWFTESIFIALAGRTGAVRYRDLIAAVADEMNRKKGPRPTFVMQADSLETFVHMDSTLANFLNKALGLPEISDATNGKEPGGATEDTIDAEPLQIAPTSTPTLAEIAALKATDTYCTRAEAEANIALFSEMVSLNRWPTQVTDLFEITVTQNDPDEVPNNLAIARWIEKTLEDPVFAVPTFVLQPYKVEEYKEVPKKPGGKNGILGDFWTRSLLGTDKEYKLETVEKTKQVLSGFEYNVPSIFNPHSFQFNPKYSSLEHYSAWIVCLFSRRQITCLYSVEHLPYKAWESTYPPRAAKWKQIAAPLKDHRKINGLAQSIINEIVEFIEGDARQRLAK